MYQQVHQKSDLITKKNIGAVFCTITAGEAVSIYCIAEWPKKSEGKKKKNKNVTFFFGKLKANKWKHITKEPFSNSHSFS